MKRKKKMKKIVFIAAMAFGLMASASTVSWNLSAPVDTTKFASGKAYLVLTTATAAPTFDATGKESFALSDVLRSTDTKVGETTVTGGSFDATTIVSSPTGRQKFYAVLISDDGLNMMISTNLKNATIQSVDSHQPSVSWSAANMGTAYTISGGGGGQGDGGAPEPTSGLLLLVGGALLGLRRKRA